MCQSLYCFKICLDYRLVIIAFELKYYLDGIWWDYIFITNIIIFTQAGKHTLFFPSYNPKFGI